MGKVIATLLVAISFMSAPLRAETVHILALGDSLTQGYGLVERDGFVPQMRAWLADKGADVRVVNAGVSGDTSAGGLNRVEWSLTPEIDAMIVALGGNDVLRGLDPAVTRKNIDGILAIAQARGIKVLLIGLTAPANYGPEYEQAFESIWPDMAEKYGVLMLPNWFAGMAGPPAEFQALMQADGLHPNAAGVAQIVEGIGPKVLDLIQRVEG